jgi:hypothetical protein
VKVSNGKTTWEEYRLHLQATLDDHEKRIGENETATHALDKRLAVLAIKVTLLGAGAGLGASIAPALLKAIGAE